MSFRNRLRIAREKVLHVFHSDVDQKIDQALRSLHEMYFDMPLERREKVFTPAMISAVATVIYDAKHPESKNAAFFIEGAVQVEHGNYYKDFNPEFLRGIPEYDTIRKALMLGLDVLNSKKTGYGYIAKEGRRAIANLAVRHAASPMTLDSYDRELEKVKKDMKILH